MFLRVCLPLSLRPACTPVAPHSSMECVAGSTGLDTAGWCSFDNIGLATLTLLSVVSMEGWTSIMYQVNHTWGFSPIVSLYFVVLIMIGSFFMLNLALAAISDEYAKADEVVERNVRAVCGHAFVAPCRVS
jgi:hypothetical protein